MGEQLKSALDSTDFRVVQYSNVRGGAFLQAMNVYRVTGQLVDGVFLRRPNRFLVLVRMDGRREKAHLGDPGRLRALLSPGVRLRLRERRGHRRRTRFEVVAVEQEGSLVMINSGFHSPIAEGLIRSGVVLGLRGYEVLEREWSYRGSRIDFLLCRDEEKCLLEVKGCTLVKEGVALFPDAPTARGAKHVQDLIKARAKGLDAAVLFLVFGQDAVSFSPNRETDPVFSRSLREAFEKGVQIYACNLAFDGIDVTFVGGLPLAGL